jgi:hypothetical protein
VYPFPWVEHPPDQTVLPDDQSNLNASPTEPVSADATDEDERPQPSVFWLPTPIDHPHLFP